MRSFPSFLRVRALLLVLAFLFAGEGRTAHADAASGTYTGSVSLRGNYYWERSTRVVAPEFVGTVATPSGVRVEASYLLDAITSASQATGVQADIGFTERRNEVQAGLGYEIDFGSSQLDVSARGRYSKEPDYLSRGVGFSAALSLNERNTVLRLAGYFIHDDVYRLERVAATNNARRLTAREPVPRGDLNTLSLGLAWDQVLGRASTFTLGYDTSILNGFQANAYRSVALNDGPPTAEKHPDHRLRHAGYVWLAQYIPATRSAVRAGYRIYGDDWSLLAHALEARVHQEVGPYVELRLKYRYYTQSASEFFNPGNYRRADEYYTADPKMSSFRDQTLGFRFRLALDFLAFTALDVLRTAVLDWNVEYIFENTNRYGRGVIAQGGLAWSF